MSTGTDFTNRTESDNEADAIDRAEIDYQKKFGRKRGSKDTGDSDSTPDETSQEEIKRLEEAGDTEAEDAKADTGSYYNPRPQETSTGGGFIKRMFGKFMGSSNAKSTAGVGAALTFAGGIALTMLGGSSFWVALEKNLTNENDDSARTNLIMRRAFNNMFKTTVCKPGQLMCKFKTASKEYVKKWKDGLFRVFGRTTDETGKPTGPEKEVVDPDKDMKKGERLSITKLIFRDGFEATTSAQLLGHADASVRARTWLTSVANGRTASFVRGMYDLTKKFGIGKGRSTPEEKKINNADEKAANDAKEKALADSDPTAAKNLPKTAIKSLSGPLGIATTAGQIACMVYNVTKITIGAVKAKWVLDLVRFAWPFIRIIAKAADGSVTDEDKKEFWGRLTQLTDYMSENQAAELERKVRSNSLSDDDKTLLGQYGIKVDDDRLKDHKDDIIRDIEEVKNKSALDSVGIKKAMFGDNAGLSEFTKQFSTAAVGAGVMTASNILNKVQQVGGGGDSRLGKQNIRTACILNSAVGNGLAATQIGICIAEANVPVVGWAAAIIQCGGQILIGAAKWVTVFYLAQKALELIIPALIGFVSLHLDLKGPAAGDALAAGIGLFLTRKSQSSALKPAVSMAAVQGFLTSTQDTYTKYTDDIAYYNAKSKPFDVNNRYSFIGQVMSSLTPYSSQSDKPMTAFSYISNLLGSISNVFSGKAMALHSQPINLTLNAENMKELERCDDQEKLDAKMLCRWNGQIVGITSARVLKWAEEDAQGKSEHLAEVIEWMQKEQKRDEGYDANSGTHDETCNEFTNLIALDFSSIGSCDDSDKPSIDEKGKTVPDSQFDKYVKYCTGQRDLEMGSTDIDLDTGSEKEQAWHSGEQCAKVMKGDSDGSYMMDAFAYYYNMCYVQYAVANGATDCTNDNPPDGGSGGSDNGAGGSCGDGSRASIYECALQFDNYLYQMGAGHDEYGKVTWYEGFKSNKPADYSIAFDCSSLVMAAIVAAFGQDIPNQVAPSTFQSDTSRWQSVPKEQAQRGDVIVQSEHVEIIKDNDPATQHFTTFGAHTSSYEAPKQIGESGFDYGSVLGTYRYIGPGVK